MRDTPGVDAAVPTPGELVVTWRTDASRIVAYGPSTRADTLRVCADQLERTLRAADDASLTLTQSASESGYSVDHLARQIREGKIPNAGRPHVPRIRRADLPRKAGFLRPEPAIGTISDARRRAVRAVVASNSGAIDGATDR